MKISEVEIYIKPQQTILLQIFFKLKFYSKVIWKNVWEADNFLMEISGLEKVNQAGVLNLIVINHNL